MGTASQAGQTIQKVQTAQAEEPGGQRPGNPMGGSGECPRRKPVRPKVGIGFRVGMLTVEEPTGQRKNGYTVWKCRCSCGGEVLLDTRCLQRGTVRDCGCSSRVGPGQKDITGMRFGKLVAVEPTGERRQGTVVWRCRCDCGGEVNAPLHQLASGFRKSCGCLGRPSLKEFVGKKFGRLVVTAYAGKEGGMHRWRCRCDCGQEVTVGQTLLQSGRTRSCGCLQAELSRERLKLVDGTSVAILEAGKGKLKCNNTSGHTGVYLDERRGKWVAQIGFKGKAYYLGAYDDKQDAVRARQRGEEMHDGFIHWYYTEYLRRGEAGDGQQPSSPMQQHPAPCSSIPAWARQQPGQGKGVG